MFGFPTDLFSMASRNHRRSNGNALIPNPHGLFNNALMLPMPFVSSPFGGLNSFFDNFGMNSSPFAMMDRMMRNGGDSLFLNGTGESNAPVHSFTSTTVMSYSGTDGRAKVYQESTSRTRGPGGLEETRQAIRDSERGINKVQIGHRIGDRKHVVEREMNVETGQISENVELENLDEEETDEFKKEWRHRSAHAGLHRRSHHQYRPQLTSHRSHHTVTELDEPTPLAIEYKSDSKSSDRSTLNSTSERVLPRHSDTIDLTEDNGNDDDVTEIHQLPASSSNKRKASWSSDNDQNSQRKHRSNRS